MTAEYDIEDYIDLIPEIRLSFQYPYENRFRPEVTDIVQLAVNTLVKELILILNNGDNGTSFFFPLPPFFNKNSILERMNLSMCSFFSLQEIKWDSLKVLKIGYSCLENSYIEDIVSGCPVLEELELCNCWGFSELNFDCLTKLNRFVLGGIWSKIVRKKKKTDSLSISGTTVQFLEISGNLDKNDLLLGDFRNCIEAKIDYFWKSEKYRRPPLTMQQVFNSLKNVRILTCGTWIIEAVSEKFQAEFPYALGNCNSLTIHSPVDYRYQLGIMHFIESCPDVQTLIIDISLSHSELKFEEPDPSIRMNREVDKIRQSKFSGGFPFKFLKMLSCGEGTNYSTLPLFLKYLVNHSKIWKEIVIQ